MIGLVKPGPSPKAPAPKQSSAPDRPASSEGAEPMSPVTTTASALPAELEALMRQLKMPHARALAPELIATARAQRWEPAEVIKALFTEKQPAGPGPCSPPDAKRQASRPGKPSTLRTQPSLRSRRRPSRPCGPWNRSPGGRTWSSAGPSAPGKPSSSKPSTSKPSKPGCAWHGSGSRTSEL